MAGKTFYLLDATASGYPSLSETSGTPANMGTGWIVGTATANSFGTMLYGFIRARNTLTTGTNPLTTSAAPGPDTAWRSVNRIDGTFTSGTAWAFNLQFRTSTTAQGQQGRIQARLWKSTSGATAGSTELTIGTAAGFLTFSTSAAFATASNVTSTFSWTPTGIAAFSNEYLFIQPIWNTVVAGGTTNANVVWRSTDSTLITSDFTPATVQVTGTASVTLSDTRNALRFTRSTSAADSLVMVDTANAALKTTIIATGADALTLLDSRAGNKFTNATGSDSLTFTETSTASRFARGTASDSLTLTETRTAIYTTKVSSTDSLTLADTATPFRTTRSTGTDTLSLTDTAAGLRTTQSGRTDLFVLSDTQNTVGAPATVTGAITESLTLSDIRNGIAPTVVTGTILETLSLVDLASVPSAFTFGAFFDSATFDVATFDAGGITAVVPFTGGSIVESIALSDTRSATYRTTGRNTDALALLDTQNASVVSGNTRNIIETINLSDAFGASLITHASIIESITLVDKTDTITAVSLVDTHDGVRKKKKKKKSTLIEEDRERRERLRKQVTEVIHPPESPVPPLEPEEPAPSEIEPKPLTPLKFSPAVDYAGLAKDEIVAKIKSDAELKAKEQAKILELKRIEEEEEEQDLEMILESLL